jgi:CoA:oxalate CoA-transferase
MVVQAMGGVLSVTGPEGGPATRVGVSIGDLAAGLFGVIGLQAALLSRARTGVGRHVDVAMLDCQVALLENALARLQVEGTTPGPIGSRHPSITPFGLFEASDGMVVIAAGNDTLFARLCQVIGLDVAGDERFATNAARCTNHIALRDLMETRLATATVDQWVERLRAIGLPCGRVNDVAAVMREPQIVARNMLIELPTPDGRTLTVADTPIRLVGDAPRRHRAAPGLDEHRGDLLRELGLTRGLDPDRCPTHEVSSGA